MDEGDTETMVAYYCFINLGWPPHKYSKLPFRERSLIAEFVARELARREKEQKNARNYGRKFRR